MADTKPRMPPSGGDYHKLGKTQDMFEGGPPNQSMQGAYSLTARRRRNLRSYTDDPKLVGQIPNNLNEDYARPKRK